MSWFKLVLYAITALIGIIFLLNYFEYLNLLINFFFLTKLTSDSGLERMDSISHAWASFLDSPLLGVGWASVTSFDLWVLLLSNVGTLGCVAFAIFLVSTLCKSWSNIFNTGVQVATLNSISFLLFSSFWATQAVAGWSFQFMTSYFVIGIALASIKLSNKAA